MTTRLQAPIAEDGRVAVDLAGDDVLARVRVLRAAEGAVDRWLVDAVAEARAGGHSWQTIGDALGISRQAAWETFRALGRQVLDEKRRASGLSEDEAMALAVVEVNAVRRRGRR
ncbi:MAG: hypothetical protein ACYDB3_11825 [Acidimicrobiales bacterium]